jgi:hypothetical protein
MRSFDVDKLVMLLSADWFFPHWHLTGIFTEDKKKSSLREGCREIVQQIISGATQYYETSFSVARVTESRAMLDVLLRRCDLEDAAGNRIKGLISREESGVDHGTRWLLVVMTDQLLENSMTAPLDAALTEALRKEWDRWQNLGEIDFKRYSLHPGSNWDKYLRNLTPDQPTMLADYVSNIASESKFEVLWGLIATLTAKQRDELFCWYRATGQSLTGELLRLPPEP